jgi:predicted nucleic acid-binding protein
LKSVVVDASIAAKWVVEEEHSGKAATLLADTALQAPAHWLAEAVNVLWARSVRGMMTEDQALERAEVLSSAPVASVALTGLVQAAIAQSLACGITLYDSLYVALAIQRGIPLVTADRKLVGKLTQAAVDPRLIVWVGDLD